MFLPATGSLQIHWGDTNPQNVTQPQRARSPFRKLQKGQFMKTCLSALTHPLKHELPGFWRLAAGLMVLHACTGSVLAADPLTSADRLRQFMEQVRPQPSASDAGGQAVRDAAAASPARLQERADLLKAGESGL